MDPCETVSYLLYSAGGQNAGVEWTVIHRDDVPKVNEYLRQAMHLNKSADPVCTQTYILSAVEIQLLKKQGVHVYSIHQPVGSAIFIPAGCAYQVCQ